MNPNKQKPVVEPNFEGEEMKVPPTMQIKEEEVPNTSLVSGPILILLFVILLMLLGGIYYWYTMLMNGQVASAPTRPTIEMNNEPESPTAEARTSATDIVSTSDELDAINADIESTRFDDLEDSFVAIENELGSALGANQ